MLCKDKNMYWIVYTFRLNFVKDFEFIKLLESKIAFHPQHWWEINLKKYQTSCWYFFSFASQQARKNWITYCMFSFHRRTIIYVINLPHIICPEGLLALTNFEPVTQECETYFSSVKIKIDIRIKYRCTVTYFLHKRTN